MFKKGDKVVCVRNDGMKHDLTLGAHYTIERPPAHDSDLVGYDGGKMAFSWRFELVTQEAATNTTTAEPTFIGGLKYDTGKPACELLSPIALLGTSAVLAFGAKKYAAHNWRKGLPWSKVIGAIMRHLLAIMRGEDIDPESGLPHVDHLNTEVMFLQEFFRTHKHLDDRFKPSVALSQETNKKESNENGI